MAVASTDSAKSGAVFTYTSTLGVGVHTISFESYGRDKFQDAISAGDVSITAPTHHADSDPDAHAHADPAPRLPSPRPRPRRPRPRRPSPRPRPRRPDPDAQAHATPRRPRPRRPSPRPRPTPTPTPDADARRPTPDPDAHSPRPRRPPDARRPTPTPTPTPTPDPDADPHPDADSAGAVHPDAHADVAVHTHAYADPHPDARSRRHPRRRWTNGLRRRRQQLGRERPGRQRCGGSPGSSRVALAPARVRPRRRRAVRRTFRHREAAQAAPAVRSFPRPVAAQAGGSTASSLRPLAPALRAADHSTQGSAMPERPGVSATAPRRWTRPGSRACPEVTRSVGWRTLCRSHRSCPRRQRSRSPSCSSARSAGTRRRPRRTRTSPRRRPPPIRWSEPVSLPRSPAWIRGPVARTSTCPAGAARRSSPPASPTPFETAPSTSP